MERNLITGSVFKNVVLFSLPYLLSYFLQTLYGMADLFIIGQYENVAGTTAVSIGSQVMHMLTVMIVGLAMGTTVSIGQAVRVGDRRRAAQDIGNTVTLFMAVSVALTVALLLFVRPIVSVMSTPEEAVSGAAAYLTICFIGFRLSRRIISSAQFFAVWATERVPCILLPSPALPISVWTISLWAFCVLGLPARRSARRSLRPSASSSRWPLF